MHIQCKKLAAVLLLLLSTVFLIPLGAAADTRVQKRTVRVGVAPLSYFSEIDENGNRVGILYDYLIKIAKYAGWDIEYVDADVQGLLDLCAAGEVDVIGGIRKDDSTKEMFSFPELSSVTTYTCIITKDDQSEYVSNDLTTFSDLRLGVYEKAKLRKADLDAFCGNNNWNPAITYYDDLAEIRKGMERGEVDAILSANTDLREGEKIIARFAPTLSYFAVTKGNSQIVRDLNRALESINTFEPDLDEVIYNKYFGEDNRYTELNRQELAYIAQQPSIRVACVDGWQPVSYLNPQTGLFEGISIDVFKKIGETTGIHFEFIGVSSFEEGLRLLESKEADLYCGSLEREYVQENYGLACSVPYTATQTVAVTRSSSSDNLSVLNGGRAALPQGVEVPDVIAPEEVVYYETADKAMEAVESYRADYALVGSLAAESYKLRHRSAGLYTTPITNTETELAAVYANDLSPLFVSIMDKSIYSISETERYSIQLRNTVDNRSLDLRDFFYSNPLMSVAIIGTASLLIIAAVFLVMRMRLKYLQRSLLMGEAYRLVGEMANEYLFEYDFESATLRLPDEFCQHTGLPVILKKGGSEGVGKLYSYFESGQLKQKTTIDFQCRVSGNTFEWYRATCAVLFQDGKPARGLGKIINAQREYAEKQLLVHKANTDQLTGLYEKSYCQQMVDEWLDSVPQEQQIAFIMVDFDNFKYVNDSVGHLGGDRVLRLLSDYIDKDIETHIGGRFGGDEFFLFIKNLASLDALIGELNGIHDYMERDFTYEEKTCKVSVSMGAVYGSAGDLRFADLLGKADAALYRAKQNGRNRYELTHLD